MKILAATIICILMQTMILAQPELNSVYVATDHNLMLIQNNSTNNPQVIWNKRFKNGISTIYKSSNTLIVGLGIKGKPGGKITLFKVNKGGNIIELTSREVPIVPTGLYKKNNILYVLGNYDTDEEAAPEAKLFSFSIAKNGILTSLSNIDLKDDFPNEIVTNRGKVYAVTHTGLIELKIGSNGKVGIGDKIGSGWGCFDAAFSGNMVIVDRGMGGIQVFDMSKKDKPLCEGLYNEDINLPALWNNKAMIALGKKGLVLYDLPELKKYKVIFAPEGEVVGLLVGEKQAIYWNLRKIGKCKAISTIHWFKLEDNPKETAKLKIPGEVILIKDASS